MGGRGTPPSHAATCTCIPRGVWQSAVSSPIYTPESNTVCVEQNSNVLYAKKADGVHGSSWNCSCFFFLRGSHACVFVISAACGEPPQCMSCSVLFAAKRAVESARAEIGQQDVIALCKLYDFSHMCLENIVSIHVAGPATPEVIQQCCMVDPSQFFF